MAGLLGSWWPGKAAADQGESEKKEEEEEEGEGEKEAKDSSWVAGLEGRVRRYRRRLCMAHCVIMCVGLVKNVSEYAATVGETVKNRVQETVSHIHTVLCTQHDLSLLPRPGQPMSFVSQFQDEQEKFTREQRRLKDAAVPPWVGYNEEEQMKAQILELSAVRLTLLYTCIDVVKD